MLSLIFVTYFLCFSSVFEAKPLVSFTLKALYPRKLDSLFIRGNQCGLNWDSGLKMNPSIIKDGYEWSIDLLCEVSSSDNLLLESKVLVNDKDWMIGSNHHSIITSTNSTDSIYPWFYTTSGSLIIIENVYSKELNNRRDVIYYLPPSYYENTLKVYSNVLIMHDGQNLFDPSTSAFGTAWMAQDTMNYLINAGGSDEVLIVGPYNTADRTNEYTYIYDPSEGAGGKGDLYLDWIESTLIPLTNSKFRVSINRESLGILGSSLGGLISCYAGWTRSSVYGKVGCMSSSFWWDDNDFQKNIITKSIPSNSQLVYMDSGTKGGEESCAVYTTQVYDYYISVGYQANVTVFEYIDRGAEHNEASWSKRFYIPIQDLYPSSTV